MKMEEIVSMLEKANEAYHNGESIITDKEYDALLDKLKQIDPQHKFFQTIGALNKTKRKEKLPYHMGSLDKIKTDVDLANWIDHKKEYCISHKLDGLSATLLLKKDKVQLYSRGNGIYGFQIPHLIPYIEYPTGVNIAVRGELILPKSFVQDGKNRRNIVSGIVNSKKDVPHEIVKHIRFVAYEILGVNNMTPYMMFVTLEELGFKVSPYKRLKNITYDLLIKLLYNQRKEGEYDIDGLVIHENIEYKPSTSGNPAYAVAFKPGEVAERTETIVTHVEWEPSRNGILFPIVHFKPIILGESTIKKCSGKNAAFIRDNKIGTGAIIIVVKSGDVIPNIDRVVKGVSSIQYPMQKFKWSKTGVHICIDEQSDDVLINTLTHFAKTMQIEHLSKGHITRLVERKEIEHPYQLYQLTSADFEALDGYKKDLAKKLVKSIQASKTNFTLINLMIASNVFGSGMGRKRLEKILEVYPQPHTQIPSIDELLQIQMISDVYAKQFYENVVAFNEWLRLNRFVAKEEKKSVTKNSLIVVFSGIRPKEIIQKIVEKGGTVSENINKDTTVLVVKQFSNSKKIEYAQKNSIPVMLLDEFINKILI